MRRRGRGGREAEEGAWPPRRAPLKRMRGPAHGVKNGALRGSERGLMRWLSPGEEVWKAWGASKQVVRRPRPEEKMGRG